jgi:hypothetical protein
MSSKLWKEVDEALASGKRPVIEVHESARVIERAAPGRPRTKNRNKPFSHFAMHTPGGRAPMRCRAPGCMNRMKARQLDIVCSERCRKSLTDYCEVLLSILRGEVSPEDLPPQYRTSKLRRTI